MPNRRGRSVLLAVVATLALLGVSPVVAQESPTPDETTDQTLLEQMLTGEQLPEGPTFIGFFRGMTVPGFEENITAEEAVGPALLYMLGGELTVQSEAPLLVKRGATGTVEEIAPNTETVIQGGDSVFFQRNAPRRAMNAGTEPATWLVGLIIPPGPPPAPREGVISMPLGFIGIEETSLFPPGGPVTVTMRQIGLAAGGEYTIDATPAIVYVQAGGVALLPTGRLSFTKGPGENATPGPNTERPDTLFATPGAEVQIVGTDTAIVGGGGSVTIKNVEDRPAVIQVMSIVPSEGGGAATPAATPAA